MVPTLFTLAATLASIASAAPSHPNIVWFLTYVRRQICPRAVAMLLTMSCCGQLTAAARVFSQR